MLLNGECVEERKCSQCDEFGHFPGDVWSTDTCTNCSCTEGKVQCKQLECPEQIVCSQGEKVKTVEGTEKDCCPKHICGKVLI